MSKISEYIDKVRKAQEVETIKEQTVEAFAEELKKSPELLLEQLIQAGVNKKSTSESLTDSDKQKLLSYLQKKHSTKVKRKKITLTYESEEDKLIKAVAEMVNGADRECLEYFTDQVVWGEEISSDLQKIVNLLLAKSVISGSLPVMKLGRPKSQKLEELGLQIANDYWNLRDSGVSYSDAVGQLALKIHKDERHVMRLIEKHKKSVGLTFEERESKRSWYSMLRKLGANLDMYQSLIGKWKLEAINPPELEIDDYFERLDELISQTISARKPLTKKI